jgi:hypothetical protein
MSTSQHINLVAWSWYLTMSYYRGIRPICTYNIPQNVVSKFISISQHINLGSCFGALWFEGIGFVVS